MRQLFVTARLTIRPGRLEDFKAAAARCVKSVREKDRGTARYDWFFNADQTECVVQETYAGSEAVLEHIEHLGDAFPELLETADIFIELYGQPSPALREVTEGLPHRIYDYFLGLDSSEGDRP